MRVHRRGFALIMVLIAVAGVFALALHSATIARTTTIESRVVRERIVGERQARAAAAIALEGLMVLTREQRAAAESDATGEPAAPAGQPGSNGDVPGRKLPEMIRILLEESGVKIDDEAEEVLDAQEAAQARAVVEDAGRGDPPRITGFSFLQVVGIPMTPVDVEVDGVTYRVRFADAIGQLNINEADDDQLNRYFLAMGLPTSIGNRLTDQLIDWRDADDFVRPLGAERERYLRLGIEIRNDRFQTIDELRFLPAMTPDLFERIRRDLCLSGSGAIHAGSASQAVLSSVEGLGPATVQRIIDRRAGGDLTPEEFDNLIGDDEELRKRIRIEPTNYVSLHVTRAEGPGPEFEGVAVISDAGISHVGLMPK